MNKIRKEKIHNVMYLLEQNKITLEKLKDEEEDYYDNMPENLQNSLRGADSEDFIDLMDEALEYLDDAISNLSEII